MWRPSATAWQRDLFPGLQSVDMSLTAAREQTSNGQQVSKCGATSEMSDYRDSQRGFKQGNAASTRPAIVTDEHLDYLDELRESGDTNMYGAVPYLREQFPALGEKDASTVLGYWMRSFRSPNR